MYLRVAGRAVVCQRLSVRMPPIAASVLVALSLLAPATAQAAGTCVADASWGSSNAGFAAQVVTLVNQERARNGLPGLSVSSALTRAADWKSLHMAGYGYMAHDDPAPPVARSAFQRIADCGYASSGVGENVAYGQRTPADVMAAWMSSPGHRDNILRASFRAIGVGAAVNSAGVWFWTQDFGAVSDGATPPPPAPPPPPPPPPPTPPAPGTPPPPGTPSTPPAPGAPMPAAPGSSPSPSVQLGPASSGVLTVVRRVVHVRSTRVVYWIIDGGSRQQVRVLARDGKARILRVVDQPKGWRVKMVPGRRSLVVLAPHDASGKIEVAIGRGAGVTRVLVHVKTR
jgi:uncharacterized protein YkwD